MNEVKRNIEGVFIDSNNLDHFLENPEELEYVLYECLTQGDTTHFIQILTLLKRRLNQTAKMTENIKNETAYEIGYSEGILNLCMKIATYKSEKEMKE